MTVERIALLITAIGSLAGLVVFFINRHDKAKDPLPKQAVEVALAKESLGLVKDSRDTLIQDVARLAERIDEQDAKIARLELQHTDDAAIIETQQVEITSLKRRVNGMIEDRDELLSYVVDVHDWAAGGSRPPAPIPPRHLADVLPPWESGDGQEVTPQTFDDTTD